MIEIIIALIIWCWRLTPLWLNIILSVLLFFRFSWRVLLTFRKFLEWNKSFDNESSNDRAFYIIKRKLVDITDLYQSIDLYTYNSMVKYTYANGVSRELTQEEYDLLKQKLRFKE